VAEWARGDFNKIHPYLPFIREGEILPPLTKGDFKGDF